MKYNIETTPDFEKNFKLLVKKYASIVQDLKDLLQSLEEQPTQGTSLGKNCYKIRLAIKSKGKGKSGGARIITYVVVDETTVYLLSIYDKKNKESLTKKELDELLKQISD